MRKTSIFIIFLIYIFITGCQTVENKTDSPSPYSPEIVSLIEAMGNKNSQIAMEGQKKLIKMKEEAFLPLVDALKNENPRIRGYAAYALGQIGDERAVNLLAMAAKDDYKTVRLWAIMAMGHFKDPEIVDILKATLKDEDKMVRAFSVQSLGNIGSNDARRALKEALIEEKNPFVIKIMEKIIEQLERRHKS